MNMRVLVLTGLALALAAAPLAAGEPMLRTRAEVTDAVLARLVDAARRELALHRGEARRAVPARPRTGDPLASRNGVRVTFLQDGRPVGFGESDQASLLANARLAAARALDLPDLTGGGPVACLVEVFLPEEPLSQPNPILVLQRVAGGREGFRLAWRGEQARVPASMIHLYGRGTKAALATAWEAVFGNRPMPPTGEGQASVVVVPSVMALSLPGREPVRLYRGGEVVPVQAVHTASLVAALERAAAYLTAQATDAAVLPAVYQPMTDRATQPVPTFVQELDAVAALALADASGPGKAVRAHARQALDRLFDVYYMEHPLEPWAYLKPEDRPPYTRAAADGLSALVRLGLTQDTQERARRLAAFLQAMRGSQGLYAAGLDLSDSDDEARAGARAQLALAEWARASETAQVWDGLLESLRGYGRVFAADGEGTMLGPHLGAHVQAAVRVYRATHNREAADFALQKSDLLASAQQRGPQVPADARGRFFLQGGAQTRRAQSAAETAVCVQGLVDGFALARELGDRERADRYRTAIVWGLRRLLQLQIRGDLDTWCMPAPSRATGGIRTREDEAAVRIEGHAGAVRAFSRALAVLTEDDYRLVHRQEAP